MSIEKAKWLVEFYQQVADGGEMQVLYKAHWSLAASGPDLDSLQEHWRVVMPPKVMPVDMSVLVNSGIDCECWQKYSEYRQVGKLLSIDKWFAPYMTDVDAFEHCQPRMNYWFSRLNFGDVFALMDRLREAGFSVEEGCFAAFQITGIAKGRCWPWEQGE